MDTKGEFGRLLYRWATGIVLAAVGTELLPVVLGTGDEAIWDWSFTYVTARFVLLPIFCAVHLALVVAFLVLRHRQETESSWLPALSATVSAGYLFVLRIYPLPWFISGAT